MCVTVFTHSSCTHLTPDHKSSTRPNVGLELRSASQYAVRSRSTLVNDFQPFNLSSLRSKMSQLEYFSLQTWWTSCSKAVNLFKTSSHCVIQRLCVFLQQKCSRLTSLSRTEVGRYTDVRVCTQIGLCSLFGSLS